MSETVQKLKGQLNLIDEAARKASSQFKNTCVYHSVDWEIGMSIAGSDGDTTPTPYVNVVFRGIDNDGKVHTFPTTFSLAQFNDFVQNVQRMHKSLSSVR